MAVFSLWRHVWHVSSAKISVQRLTNNVTHRGGQKEGYSREHAKELIFVLFMD